MPELLRTTTNKKHYHVVYMKDDGTAVMAVADKHTHLISYRQATELVIDPATGQPLQQATEGAWVITPADKHTHDLEGQLTAKPEKGNADETHVKRAQELFKAAKDFEKDFRTKGKESYEFYKGNQWEKKDVDDLKAQERAALTINYIRPKIRTLCGIQRQNRYDIKFFPVEGGDQMTAEILTSLVKNITEQNNYDYTESHIFKDGVIAGRGQFNVYMDFNKSLEGDVQIEQYAWDAVYYGEHFQPDLTDCEYVIKTKWLSKAKLKQLFPDKWDEIKKDCEDLESGEPKVHLRIIGDQYNAGNALPTASPDTDFADVTRKEYRVLEVQEKEYHTIPVLVDVSSDFYRNLDGISSKDLSMIKTIQGVQVINKQRTKIRSTMVAGYTFLNTVESDEEDFSIIPYYASLDEGQPIGAVEPVKDVQREINKRRSQAVDILNKVASYGWYYDDKTFPDQKAEQEFLETASTPGGKWKVDDVTRPPVQVQGVKMPAELANYETVAAQSMQQIMNVNLEMQGQQSNASSGIAIQWRNRQGMTGNEDLFDNLQLTKRLLGRKLLKLIQKYYSPDRIVRILDNAQARMPVEIGGQPMGKYDKRMLAAMLAEKDLSKYDVVVSESPASPTIRQANFAIWADIATKRPEVPMAFLLELSDLSEKDKAMQMFMAQQQQAVEQENKKYDTEIEKSVIAAKSKAADKAPAYNQLLGNPRGAPGANAPAL